MNLWGFWEILGKGWFFDSDVFKYLEPIVLWKMKELPSIGKIPYYLGSFDINYIVFKNVEIFRFFFFKEQLWKEILNFKNNLFVKMNISKLINESNICQKLSRYYYNNGKLLLRQNRWSQQPNGKEVLNFQNFLRLKIVLYHRFWAGDKTELLAIKVYWDISDHPKKTHMNLLKFKRFKKNATQCLLATAGVVEGVSFVWIDF